MELHLHMTWELIVATYFVGVATGWAMRELFDLIDKVRERTQDRRRRG